MAPTSLAKLADAIAVLAKGFEVTLKNATADVEAVEGEPESDDSAIHDFKEQMAKGEVQEALLEAKRQEMREEWERSEEDIAEYERQLVTIDEAGEAMAEQRSLEKLIAQLQKDKQFLETIVKASGAVRIKR